MPILTIWMLRAALLHLGIGFTFGAVMLFNRGVPIHGALWRLLPAHIETVLVGWTVQLALGVAYWILPRFHKYVQRDEFYDDPRGNIRLAWVAFVLLNVGVICVAIANWLPGVSGVLLLVGRVAESGAAVSFALHAWPRIKPAGK